MARSSATAALLLALAMRGGVAAADERITADQAVAIALAQNRDAIAARFEIEAAELDRIAAAVYPNPWFSYTLGNLVLGTANEQGMMPPVRSNVVGQTVQTLAISSIIDVWDKRHARMRSAERGLEQRRLMVRDALREIDYAVRTAFNDVVGEMANVALARQNRARYSDTIRISRARRDAGDISDAEVRKIELEGLRYDSAVIDEEMQLDLAHQKLAALLALGPAADFTAVETAPGTRPGLSFDALLERAHRDRPDLLATRAAWARAEAAQRQARTEAFPDLSLGLAFTHSEFTVSGDNPNSLALSLSLPLPIFDRNQANIGRADLDRRRADNETARVEVQIRHELADALRRVHRAAALLDLFERGGMLERADAALQVAERSYKTGAVSLLELLEAQRTFIETREQYLHARRDYGQAMIDLAHAIAGNPL